MNDIIKQRLVGALILLALGVVFWPIIFVEPGDRSAQEVSRIPQPPLIDSTPIEEPDRDEFRDSPEWDPGESDPPAESQYAEPAAAAEDMTTLEPTPAQESRTRQVAPEQPVLDDKGVPVAWILLVASVSSETKAGELRDRLLAMQEKAYVKRIEQGQKVLYRVYIGPNFERAQLEKIQASVDSGFGVSSLIVRYVP